MKMTNDMTNPYSPLFDINGKEIKVGDSIRYISKGTSKYGYVKQIQVFQTIYKDNIYILKQLKIIPVERITESYQHKFWYISPITIKRYDLVEVVDDFEIVDKKRTYL